MGKGKKSFKSDPIRNQTELAKSRKRSVGKDEFGRTRDRDFRSDIISAGERLVTVASRVNNNSWSVEKFEIERGWWYRLRSEGKRVRVRYHARGTILVGEVEKNADGNGVQMLGGEESYLTVNWAKRDTRQLCIECPSDGIRSIFSSCDKSYDALHDVSNSQTSCLALSHSANQAVTADTFGNIRITDLITGNSIRKIKTTEKLLADSDHVPINQILFHPSLRQVITIDEFANIALWWTDRDKHELLRFHDSIPKKANLELMSVLDACVIDSDRLVTVHGRGVFSAFVVWSLEKKRAVCSIEAIEEPDYDKGYYHIVPLCCPVAGEETGEVGKWFWIVLACMW